MLKGVKMLNLRSDDTVLVIGQGPIGLMHAALASQTGAKFLPLIFFPSATPSPRASALLTPFMPAKKMSSNA